MATRHGSIMGLSHLIFRLTTYKYQSVPDSYCSNPSLRQPLHLYFISHSTWHQENLLRCNMVRALCEDDAHCITVADCLSDSSTRQLWIEGIQDHSWMHVIRLAGMAGLGPGRGRGPEAYQSSVRAPSLPRSDVFVNSLRFSSYDAGINTFDTANVSHCDSVHSGPENLGN